MSENHEEKYVVYKLGFTDKARRAAVAFANSHGGKIYVGVDDYGEVAGVDDAEEVKRKVAQALREGVLPDISPYVDYSVEYPEGKKVLAVEVARGAGRPYWLSDRGVDPSGVFVSRDGRTESATYSEIRAMIESTSDGGFESARSTEQNLTFQQIAAVFKRANARLEREDLADLGLVDAWGAHTNLALLLSDQCPSFLTVATPKERGSETIERRELTGSLFKQYEDALALVDRCNRKFVKTLDGRNVATREYREFPVEILREAFANAIVHRDYSKSSPTLARVYDDRVEIVSRGGLAESLEPKDLALGVSVARNPRLARVFQRFGACSLLGRGIGAIRDAYRGSSIEPKFEITRSFFKITLYNAFERAYEKTTLAEARLAPQFLPVDATSATTVVETRKSEPTFGASDLVFRVEASPTPTGRVIRKSR